MTSRFLAVRCRQHRRIRLRHGSAQGDPRQRLVRDATSPLRIAELVDLVDDADKRIVYAAAGRDWCVSPPKRLPKRLPTTCATPTGAAPSMAASASPSPKLRTTISSPQSTLPTLPCVASRARNHRWIGNRWRVHTALSVSRVGGGLCRRSTPPCRSAVRCLLDAAQR
ncbi:MAG: hypothetical protein R2856_23275 [Caldilineaceae bacterium]